MGFSALDPRVVCTHVAVVNGVMDRMVDIMVDIAVHRVVDIMVDLVMGDRFIRMIRLLDCLDWFVRVVNYLIGVVYCMVRMVNIGARGGVLVIFWCVIA